MTRSQLIQRAPTLDRARSTSTVSLTGDPAGGILQMYENGYWLLISPDSHYRCSPELEKHLRYVARTAACQEERLSPADRATLGFLPQRLPGARDRPIHFGMRPPAHAVIGAAYQPVGMEGGFVGGAGAAAAVICTFVPLPLSLRPRVCASKPRLIWSSAS